MGPSTADGELKRKIEEYKAREDIYVSGLISQEAEMNQLRQMASDVQGAYGDLSRAAVRGALVEPVQNMEVLMLRQKALEKDQQIGKLREELEANRFDQRLPNGQAIMRKCKALLVENRELGEEIREERLSELSAAVAAEQRTNGDLLQKCREATEFCAELSQENDKLQGTIAKVAGRLREARNELEVLRKDRAEAKAKRKKEREQQKKVAAPALAPPSSTPAEAAAAPPSAPPGADVAAVARAPEPGAAEAGAPSSAPVAVVEVPLSDPPLSSEPAEKKKKRKSDAAEEAHAKDKKEKKRRKAEKSGAAASASGQARTLEGEAAAQATASPAEAAP